MNHCLPLSLLSPLKFIPALCALSLATTAAVAATGSAIYRCGPRGDVYSQVPCADGRPIVLDDARDERQRREAEAGVQRDQALADRLRRQRLEEEAATARAPRGPAGIRGVPEQQASASHLHDWERAGGPKPKHGGKAKKKDKPAVRRAGA